ncbi:hypothetical protein [Halobacillus sp. BBL2006]|uniref:hypothetical protein n=1 Tax=Halobacillus sp. BBL2006 TaxID=1543706 RepID=UPI000543A291|nr:hypothetical protein [Halobacillus sp. BBL2006]KHE67945.1 hypothetical protein LD39_15630 [Halobacillus sp. BBL2006]
MFLLTTAQGGMNTGDVIIQVIFFLVMIAVPLAFLYFFINIRKQGNELKRIEGKLDVLVEDHKKEE